MATSLTLPSRFEHAADSRGSVTFVIPDGPDGYAAERLEWSRLHEEARAYAAALQTRGAGPGSHVALLGPTSRAFVTAIQATWLTGATLVVLPLPMRLGSVDEFVAATQARIRAAAVDLLVVDPQLEQLLPDPAPGDPPVATLTDLGELAERSTHASERFVTPHGDPDALALLQFTSGSTASPKGVMIPHRVALANIDAAVAAADLDLDHDVAVSWLPLYHDMGLVGLLTIPMATGADLVLGAPQDFLGHPARWLRWMSDFRGTITAGPNFSYALAARALRRTGPLDLSRWRIALNGAEPVDPDAVETFCAAAAPHGFDRRAVFCAFGMAEVTIAGTFPRPFSGMTVDTVDRRVLESDRYAAPVVGGRSARRLARLGRPVAGLTVRVVDPASGERMRDREVGELEVRGTSVTTGYHGQPDATAAAFHDGWLRTGDLAYLVEGELVVCGRIKDVIIVGGRNVFPEDVERAAASVTGVRAGNVIAFGVEGRRGRESVVVVAETKDDDVDAMRRTVATRVRDAVGLAPEEIVLVRPGTLPKTSSGKLQRSLCRSRYLDRVLEPV